MNELIYELPSDIPISQHIKDISIAYMKLLVYGIYYYVPITKSIKKLFSLKIRDGKLQLSYNQINYLEDFFRDLIMGMQIQIRDTIGGEIHREISENIQSQFNKLFSVQLDKTIESELHKRIGLPEKTNIDQGE